MLYFAAYKTICLEHYLSVFLCQCQYQCQCMFLIAERVCVCVCVCVRARVFVYASQLSKKHMTFHLSCTHYPRRRVITIQIAHRSLTGARTSFKLVAGVTFGQALSRDVSAYPEEFRTARFCEKWAYRCEAAARTWMRPHAQDNLM